MHTPCWDILEASWDYMESRPFDFTAMADIFIAQPRYQAGTLPPHYSVMACWFLFAGYASRFFERDKHQAPDDFSYVSSICEQEHRRCRTLSPASRCMAISKRQMRNTRPFSTLVAIDQLPLELCLRILCYLPTVSVKAARLASRAMADVPLAGTYWKSRFSRPDLAHIPLSSLLQPSKTHAEGVVDLKPVLSRCTGQNISREQIIIYAKALIEIVKQRRKVLELPTYPCLPEDIVCHRFLSVPRDSHKDWQISDKLKEWRSSVIFDRERPISSCYEIKLTFIPSHRDRYLSGIEFHFPQYILTLGYTEADTKLAIEHGKFQRTGVLGISSSDYGFLEVWAADEVDDIVSETEGFDEADNGCDKSWKSALFPAKSSQIYGFQAELSVVCHHSTSTPELTLKVYRTTVSPASDYWSLRAPSELQLIVLWMNFTRKSTGRRGSTGPIKVMR